jgi:hypothetical protein
LKPELGPQPWDNFHPQAPVTGVARLHEGQDVERSARQAVHPLEKMKLVWTGAYRGNSGTETLKGV